MRKLLLAIPMLAMIGLMAAPAAHAETSARGLPKYLHSEASALDGKGDRNGIGLFKRSSESKSYVFVNGRVTAISDTSITVLVKSKNEDGTITTTSFTFGIDATTKIIRKFKGTASVAEVAVNDKVMLWGTAFENGVAKLIWDKSIWWGQIKGTVADLNTTTKTFKLILKQKQLPSGVVKTVAATVKYTDTTTFWLSDGITATTVADLSNGDVVKVRGSWNSANKYFLASKIIFQ